MLEDDFRQRTLFARFHPQPAWTDDGLMLGAGTCLLRSHDDIAGEAGERLLAILSTASLHDADRAVLGHVDAARRHWRRGDKAVAQLRLAYAGLPRIDESGAFRVFLADHVLARGLSPASLRKELGFGDGSEAYKYSAAQPRVPAGSGTESGRWTSGDAAPVIEGRSVDAGVRVRTAFLDDRRGGDIDERAREKQENAFRTETFEDARAHGHPIPLLPDIPFGMPIPAGVTTGPKERVEPKANAGGGDASPPGRGPPNDDRSRLCPDPQNDRGAKDEFSRLDQEYVGTLVNPGLNPRVPGTQAYKFSTPTEKNVYIDHCNYKTGKLIEDKGHYEDIQKPGFFQDLAKRDWINQAKRQLDVARYLGRKLEWWFYEKESMELARQWFKDNKIKGIKLRQVDYPGDGEWPYPPSAKWAKGRQK